MKQKFVLRPPLAPALPFGQQIELQLNGEIVGVARWHAQDGNDGIIQVAELNIVPGHQRQGHGSALLNKIYVEAKALFATLNIPPRRVWMIVEQKRHVTARAFLSRHGFQHVSTMTALYRGQDGMLYQKSFD